MWRLPRLDRLAVRLAVGVALLVVGLLAIGFYAQAWHDSQLSIDARRRAADLQTQFLEVTLRHEMLDKDRKLINAVLQDIGKQPEVQGAMILDHQGVVKFASRPEQVNQRIPQASPTCQVCHAKRPEDRSRWVRLDGENGSVLRTVRPIENRPECYECHDSANKMNGMLILDVSLAEVEDQMRRATKWMAIGAGILGLLLFAGVGFLVRVLVLRRVAALGRAARSIAAGNLAERAPVQGKDIIASLAQDLNDMADAGVLLLGEVRGREHQLREVINSLDDGLLVLDRNFTILAANQSFCRRLGCQPEALRGRRCHEAIGKAFPCYASDNGCPASRCLAKREVQRAVLRRDDAEDTSVYEVYASPVFDDDGHVSQVVEIWRDISERVREETHLAEIERLVSLGTLASGFSHEMNTPLASVLACAEGILDRIDSPADTPAETLPAIRHSADIVRKEILRCRRITDQFLRFARGIPPSIEPVELRKVVESVVSLVGATAREKKVAIRVEGDELVPSVTANTEVVQHVVLNLLVNALQSIDGQGGEVVVTLCAGPDVRIRIRDTGCGIALADRRHLFEPFRSRKPQGTGLGLFLSRSLMRRFGGDVSLLESEAGVGTTFEVIFPHTAEVSR